MEECTKSSQEIKRVEIERSKYEKQIPNGSDRKRNTWKTTTLVKSSRQDTRMKLGETSEKVNTSNKWETWWWNQEVQEKLMNKRKAKKYGIPPEMM